MDELKPLSEAASYEDFKSQRAAGREAPAGPAEKTPQTEEVTPVKTESEPGTGDKVIQEAAAEKPVDDQIKELRAKGQHAKANKLEREAGAAEADKKHAAEIARLKQENETLRRPASERPAAEKPAEVQADASDPEPKATDEKYAGAQGYEKYLRDCGRWDYRQEEKKRGAEAGQRAATEALRTKVAAAKTKYADFDAATTADVKAGTGLILTPSMVQYIRESDAGMDVLYHLGKNPEEYARVKALSATLQLAELGYLGKLITTPAANKAVPEVRKTPAVSRVSAPPRVLSGAAEAPAKSLSEASSYEEFRQLRKRSA